MNHGIVAWLTGLSGSGKSTIVDQLRPALEALGRRVRVLDGDDVRERLHRHLGFSPEDIRENNRLIAEVAAEALADWDVILVPVIAPFRDARAASRERLAPAYHEIYVHASLESVRARDPKGLYGRAARGDLPGLIGVDASVPYEPPENPDLVLDSEADPSSVLADKLLRYLLSVV